MTRLIVVRHAETTWPGGRLIGRADPPLSDYGRSQADTLAAHFAGRRVDAIAVSPLLRARETAEPLASVAGCVPIVCKPFAEIDAGVWQGLDPAEFGDAERALYERWLTEPLAPPPAGGESPANVARRAVPCLERLIDDYAERSILVVTHSVVARILVSHVLGFGLDLVGRIKLKRASVTEVRLSARGPVLVALGTMHASPLPQPAA